MLRQVTEVDILGKVERACDPDATAGEWISRYDLVEDGTRLLMRDQGDFGECNSECRTIAKACESIVGDHDTDIAEELVKVHLPLSSLSPRPTPG